MSPQTDRSTPCNATAVRRALTALITAAPVMLPAWAQVYVGQNADPSNAVVLSNHPSALTPTLLVPIDWTSDPTPSTASMRLGASADARLTKPLRIHPLSPALDERIRAVARDYAVTESLVKAVIAVESGFEARARSPKGAIGLMQVMPETARRFGVADAAAVDANLRAGTAYLRWLLDLFAGDLQLTLAAYNAGEAAVLRAGLRVPNYPETQAYVPKVLSYLARYEAQQPRR